MMITKGKVESSDSKLNFFFWLLGIVSILASYSVNKFYLDSSPLIVKFLVYLVGFIASVFSVYNTKQGGRLFILWQESVAEIQKVVWPTKKETLQTTGVVLLMIFIMGLILWLLDSILIKLVAFVTSIG